MSKVPEIRNIPETFFIYYTTNVIITTYGSTVNTIQNLKYSELSEMLFNKFTHPWSVKLMDALSDIAYVLEIIGQRQKFNGTVATFSLKDNNGEQYF